MAMFRIKSLLCAIALPMIASCSPTDDMQGRNPQEYYAAHPIENKIESKDFHAGLQFKNTGKSLPAHVISALHNDLADINPHAVTAIYISSANTMAYKQERMKYVHNLLIKAGFTTKAEFFTKANIARDKVVVDIVYNAVIPPDCPDWKMSPVTTYSNSLPANFGCATKTNFGMMIDDPRDLEHGKGSNAAPTERAAKAILDYRANTAPAGSTTSITGQ